MNKPFCFTLSSPMLSFVSLGQFAGCEMASHCGLIVHLYGERERGLVEFLGSWPYPSSSKPVIYIHFITYYHLTYFIF